MKTRKLRKFLMLLASALLLVSVTVGATVAFLTDTSEVVTNTFTVGSVALTLDEAKVTEYGVVDGTTRVLENEYKLIPGHTYTKDPTVHIDSESEDGWLFVKVVNPIKAIEDGTTIHDQMVALDENGYGWVLIDEDNSIYAYNRIVKKNENIEVFAEFTIKGDAEVDKYTANPITIEAYLVQADGFASDDTTPGYEKAWKDAPLKKWVPTV